MSVSRSLVGSSSTSRFDVMPAPWQAGAGYARPLTYALVDAPCSSRNRYSRRYAAIVPPGARIQRRNPRIPAPVRSSATRRWVDRQIGPSHSTRCPARSRSACAGKVLLAPFDRSG